MDPFSHAKKCCNTVLAPFSFSHVINYFPFFPFSFFFRSFSIFMVTSDRVLINCAFVSLISSIFKGSEMNCSIVDWSEGFPNMVV